MISRVPAADSHKGRINASWRLEIDRSQVARIQRRGSKEREREVVPTFDQDQDADA